MTPITPEHLYKAGLNSGDFKAVERLRHAVGIEKLPTSNSNIDTNKFGDYFLRALPELNSTLKRGTAVHPHQMVVKKQIGFRNVTEQDNGYGNSRYATSSEIFNLLHQVHVDLISRKAKQKIAQDFYKVKLDAICRYHQMVAEVVCECTDANISIADAFVILNRKPTDGNYRSVEMGYVLLNGRNIPISDIIVKRTDRVAYYHPHTDCVFDTNRYPSHSSDIRGIVSFMEEVGEGETLDTISTPLFSFGHWGTLHGEGNVPSIEMFDTKLKGFDVGKFVTQYITKFNELRDPFDADLEALAVKYETEFMLHEICSGGSAL